MTQLRRWAKESGLFPALGPGQRLLWAWGAARQMLSKHGVSLPDVHTRQQLLKLKASRHTVAGYPHLVEQWHPTKNGDLFPFQVSYGSTKRIWWRCDKGPDHEWQASVGNRTGPQPRGNNCPFCAGKKPSVTNSLQTVAPAVAKQWHKAKNAPLTPDKIVAGSHKRAWWKCSEAKDHEWQAAVHLRVHQLNACPFCAGKKVAHSNSLAKTNPSLARQWHPSKNRSLKPTQVVAGSTKEVWWKCSRGPDHEWKTAVAVRTARGRNGACPFCTNRRLSVTNSLAKRYPGIAAQWHPTKNEIAPDAIRCGSHLRVWWKCSKAPDHEWQNTVQSRTFWKSGCPFCAGRKVCFSNSLAYNAPQIALEFDRKMNRPLTPELAYKTASLSVWWRCHVDRKHIWRAPISDRVNGHGGGCPKCRLGKAPKRA